MVALKAFTQTALRLQVVPTNPPSSLLLDSRMEKRVGSECGVMLTVRMSSLLLLVVTCVLQPMLEDLRHIVVFVRFLCEDVMYSAHV